MNPIFALLNALLLAPLMAVNAADAQRNPNILIILVDDMGYGGPQCFNPQTKIASPAIHTAA